MFLFHFCFDLISKKSAQALSARVLGNNVCKEDTAFESLVRGYSLLHPLIKNLLLNITSRIGGIECNICFREFTGLIIWDMDHSGITDSVVRDQQYLEFCRCYLKATNFDQLFEAIRNIDETFLVIMGDITSSQPAGTTETLCRFLGLVQVPHHDLRTFDQQLSRLKWPEAIAIIINDLGSSRRYHLLRTPRLDMKIRGKGPNRRELCHIPHSCFTSLPIRFLHPLPFLES
jgi:hypothetical protein